MTRTVSLMLAILLSAWPSLGNAQTQGPATTATCDFAADAAERSHALPAGILAAIGRVESGRADAAGHVAPWPWTIDASGTGTYLPSLPAAVAAVLALRAQGVRNIDVGCFQVNLEQHPNAFATLEAAFDAQANADYAAGFLASLYQRTGSWDAAVAAYHSGVPALGIPYRGQVFAAWANVGASGGTSGEVGARANVVPDPRFGTSIVMAGVRVWSPAVPGTAPRMVRMEIGPMLSPDAVDLIQ